MLTKRRRKSVADDPDRGTGRTTNQMKRAGIGALYIWCNDTLEPARYLADKAGRLDLEIVGPSMLDNNAVRLKGRQFTEVVRDHALKMTEDRCVAFYEHLLPLVKPVQDSKPTEPVQ